MSMKNDLDTTIEKILTPDAKNFITEIHQKFNPTRKRLLELREERQKSLDKGEIPGFLENTSSIRQDERWRVAEAPMDLQRRWVEITGPTDKKMVINALNSGADVFMADFEDANAPTWKNMVEGQENLIEAIKGTLSFKSPEGKEYQLKDQKALLMVRPRGLHLDEKHFLVDGEPISASFFDFGLYFFHNAKHLLSKGSGPYFYLPKLESHLEARLWNEVFLFAQEKLGVEKGSIRATVLLETILAAFEMEEILYELREHAAGLNAGRWDYIFSVIKKFHAGKKLQFPDREQITMTVPFMRAYTELLVKTCHKRGAHAMGGMAAFIPSRKDQEVNEKALAKVKEDKHRESLDGFDGTWVAHPDLVPVAREIFAAALNNNPNQKEKKRIEVHVNASDLQNFSIPNSKVTEVGVRKCISVALQYLSAWLSGVGAVGIFNLMEDAATAEISRAELWLWIHQGPTPLDTGLKFDKELYKQFADEEQNKVASSPTLTNARKLLDELVLKQEFAPFLTSLAYNELTKNN